MARSNCNRNGRAPLRPPTPRRISQTASTTVWNTYRTQSSASKGTEAPMTLTMESLPAKVAVVRTMMKIPASTLDPAKKRFKYCRYCTRLPDRRAAEMASMECEAAFSPMSPESRRRLRPSITSESTTMPDFNQNWKRRYSAHSNAHFSCRRAHQDRDRSEIATSFFSECRYRAPCASTLKQA